MRVNGIDFYPERFPEGFFEGIEQLGVPHEHIEMLKKKNMLDEPDKSIYDKVHTGNETIPVDKIVGVSFNNAAGSDVITTIRRGINNQKGFYDCLDWLDGRTLKDLYKDYENMPVNHDAVDAGYYPDLDGYFINNGRHRALMALLLGVPKINARVLVYEVNPEKKIWHESVDELFRKHQIVEICSCPGKIGKGKLGLDYEITMIIDGHKATISGYRSFIEKENKDLKKLKQLDERLEKDKRIFRKLLKVDKNIRKILVKTEMFCRFADTIQTTGNETEDLFKTEKKIFNMYLMK